MKKPFLIALIPCLSLVMFGQTSKDGTGNEPNVKNIILLIGDGMGVAQVYAGLTASKGQFNMAEFRHIGFSKTHSANDFITDSGAAGTAIATGYKAYDQAIGMDRDTIPRKTILEYAEEHGKATGMVVTSEITHATPASFIAHQKDRYMVEAIAADFLKTDIDVFIGGGRDHFQKRKDQKDLTTDLALKGYQLVYQLDDLVAIETGKVAGLLYEKAPPGVSEGRNDMLPQSVDKAIELLDQGDTGFFLMVEGSQIDWAGHDNDTDYLLEELLDFDLVVGKALDFAKKDGNTLVIVTADHETGGLSITNGDLLTGEIETRYSSTHHTGVMVPVFSYGPGAETFTGIYENTELFERMMNAFGFAKNSIIF